MYKIHKFIIFRVSGTSVYLCYRYYHPIILHEVYAHNDVDVNIHLCKYTTCKQAGTSAICVITVADVSSINCNILAPVSLKVCPCKLKEELPNYRVICLRPEL